MELDGEHLTHRWHHPVLGHRHTCPHGAGPAKDDLGRLGLVLTAGRIVGGVASLGWTVYAARRLQSEWGRLSVVLSYAALASIGADLGIPLALTRLSCRHAVLDRYAVAGAIRRRAAAGSIASLVVVLAWINTHNSNGRWGLAALYGISVTINPVAGSFLALLRGKALGGVEACYTALKQLVLPIIGIAVIEVGWGILGVIAAYVVIDAGSAILVFAAARHRVLLTDVRDAGEEAALRLRATMPLSATTVVGAGYERADSAMLAPLAGTSAVGIYRMISPIFGAVLMPAKALGDAAAVGAGRPEAPSPRATAARFTVRAVLVTAPLAAALAIVGPLALPHVLGVKASAHNPPPIDWAQAAGPLRLLMLSTLPSAALAVLTPVALMAHPGRVFLLAVVALIGNIALNLALVPTWTAGLGASGAALAFLFTECGLVALLWATLPADASPSPALASGGPFVAPKSGLRAR